MLAIDEYAESVATERFGLPPCLHVPIAARDEAAVRAYVGNTCKVLSAGSPNRALLVEDVRQPKINRQRFTETADNGTTRGSTMRRMLKLDRDRT